MKIDGLSNQFQFAPDTQPKPNEPVIQKPDVVPAVQALNRPELIDNRKLLNETEREEDRFIDRKNRRPQLAPATLLAILEELDRNGCLPELRADPREADL